MECDSLVSDCLELTLYFFNFQVLTGTQAIAWSYFSLPFYSVSHSSFTAFRDLYHHVRTTKSKNSLLQQVASFPLSCSATMEENTCTIQADLFHDNSLEALPKEPGEVVAGPSTSTTGWQSLPASQRMNETSLPVSSIPPGQKQPAFPATPVSWAIN